jgi:hypothetical protein
MGGPAVVVGRDKAVRAQRRDKGDCGFVENYRHLAAAAMRSRK